jgi:ABC-type oligopeptide transport system substrate-binding subunit
VAASPLERHEPPKVGDLAPPLAAFLLVGAALLSVAGCSNSSGDTAQQPAAVDAAEIPATVDPASAPSGLLTVVFTNNIDGEIEPCG